MSIIPYVFFGIAVNVAIAIIGRSLKKRRPKMSYTEYLECYGRKEPYTSSDVHKFM